MFWHIIGWLCLVSQLGGGAAWLLWSTFTDFDNRSWRKPLRVPQFAELSSPVPGLGTPGFHDHVGLI